MAFSLSSKDREKIMAVRDILNSSKKCSWSDPLAGQDAKSAFYSLEKVLEAAENTYCPVCGQGKEKK